MQRLADSNPLARAFVDAACAAGHPRNEDFNGERQEGFGQVFAGTLVERINLRGARATGITIRNKGGRLELDAAVEVVLCAGAVNSPQLLMLSGIGPAAALERHGIKLAHGAVHAGRARCGAT